MNRSLRSSPTYLAAAVLLAVVLVPDPGKRFERNVELDIELVRSGECDYKGIVATFEELSRAYALKIFENPEFLGWTARANPSNPEAEALVSCRFHVDDVVVTAATDSAFSPTRLASIPDLEVTWRLTTLSAIRIDAYGNAARDALGVFRETVDEFLDNVLMVHASSAYLRQGPDSSYAIVDSVLAGTAVIREAIDGAWTRVRISSTAAVGWLPNDSYIGVSR